MKPKNAIFLAALFASSTAVHAVSVGITWSLGEVPGISPTSVALLVADTGGDGFSAVGSGDWLGVSTADATGALVGGDDLIIGSTVYQDLGGVFAFDTANTYDDAAIVPGDGLAIYWFDGVSIGDPIAAGTTGGFVSERSSIDTVGGRNAVMEVPGPGASVTIGSVTPSLGGSTDPSVHLANSGTVIPEPSAFTLLGMAFGSLLLRRRR